MPSKDQVAVTIDAMTPASTGAVLYPNKQDTLVFYPVIVGETFEEMVQEVTEVFARPGTEPTISTKAVMYVLPLSVTDPSRLPEDWKTRIFPMPLSRKWMSLFLQVMAEEESPIAVLKDGALDSDGTVFKMMKSGKGTQTSYSFMPQSKKLKSFGIDATAVQAPEMTLGEWADLYTESQLRRAGIPVDTEGNNGSTNFEM